MLKQHPLKFTKLTPLVLASIALYGCGGGSSSGDSSSPVLEQPSNAVVFSLGVSDDAVDDAIVVSIEIDSITLKPVDSSQGTTEVVIDQFTDESDQTVDTIKVNLLDYQGASQLKIIDELQNIEVMPGDYTMELTVIDEGSYVMLDNDTNEYAIKVPSSRLRLGEFVVIEGAEQSGEIPAYTLEFDLKKSLVQRGKDPAKNGFIIKPHGVRVVSDAGTISGTISADNTNLGQCAVYVYEGQPTLLGDLYDTDDEEFEGEAPDATAPFAAASVLGDGTYEIGFVPVGSYTVALFCDQATDDNIQFDGLTIPTPEGNQTTVDVTANQVTTVDF